MKPQKQKGKKKRTSPFDKQINLYLGGGIFIVLFFVELIIVMTGIHTLQTQKEMVAPNATTRATTKDGDENVYYNTEEAIKAMNETAAAKKTLPELEKIDEGIPDALYCETDADCTAVFSNCGCQFSCVNEPYYNQTQRVECNAVCTETEIQNKPGCLCKKNRCVNQ